ncbi:MAG: hypothetical protein QM690_13300 [Sphingobium sp.]
MTESGSIIVKYENKRPIDLLDFTASLAAFGDEFKNFAGIATLFDTEPRLFIREMRPGSVVAELFYWAQQVPILAEWQEHREIAAAFMVNWQETLQLILNLGDGAKNLPKGTVKNARTMVEPVAKDGGSQMNFIATEGGTVNVNFNLTSTQAGAIAYNAQHLLGAQPVEDMRFENEPMVLWQMRDGPPARAGDMGRIDRFSDKPKKLTFATDATKNALLNREEHPFSLIYFVSGVARTAGGKLASYHIYTVDGAVPKDED